MRYGDLREWLGIVEEMGELKRLAGAHWNLEIGAITDVVHHTEPSPALLFDEIPDYPTDRSILVNAMHSRNRLAVTMGLPTGLKDLEIVTQLRQKIAAIKPIPPRFVQTGPICENVLTGNSIDITKFPAPKWHEHDGGRYIGTGCIVFTRDPDEGWVNLGTYRVMIHDRETLGLYISPGKHGRIHRDKCFARGAPLKVAIALGNEPLLFLGSCMEMSHGVSEYDYIGGWRDAPVDVVKGEFTGLPIP
ncbi:MAG: UbiD family decarboxylase domain-containing protein, partial [Deltaproteobacteria bacterium]